MKRHKCVILSIIIIGAIGALVGKLLLGCIEVRQYEGHPLDYWLDRYGSDDPDAEMEAGIVVARIVTQERGEPRRQAIRCLALTRPERPCHLPAESVPVLIDALSDNDRVVQWYSLMVLRRLGPRAKEAARAIQPFTLSPDQTLRNTAVSALATIDPDSTENIP
jgi:hypothetical protein